MKGWGVPEMIGSMALREGGGAVVALESGFHFLDLEKGGTTPVADPEPDEPRTRFNDGKVDRQGRFLAGSMIEHGDRNDYIAGLYRLNADLTVDTLDPKISLSNGPCFSPDGKILYFSESHTGQIYAYDYDTDTGAVGPRRIHIDLKADVGGIGDGATVDADGNLWIALVFNGQIGKFDPNGKLIEAYDMPVQLPTSVMFGGPDLDELYVTSLYGMPLRESFEPIDGALLRVRGLGATGLPEPRFKG